jgi:hypothetical protein
LLHPAASWAQGSRPSSLEGRKAVTELALGAAGVVILAAALILELAFRVVQLVFRAVLIFTDCASFFPF